MDANRTTEGSLRDWLFDYTSRLERVMETKIDESERRKLFSRISAVYVYLRPGAPRVWLVLKLPRWLLQPRGVRVPYMFSSEREG